MNLQLQTLFFVILFRISKSQAVPDAKFLRPIHVSEGINLSSWTITRLVWLLLYMVQLWFRSWFTPYLKICGCLDWITCNSVELGRKCLASRWSVHYRASSFCFASLVSKQLTCLIWTERCSLDIAYTCRWWSCQLLMHHIQLSLCALFQISATILMVPRAIEFWLIKLLWDGAQYALRFASHLVIIGLGISLFC